MANQRESMDVRINVNQCESTVVNRCVSIAPPACARSSRNPPHLAILLPVDAHLPVGGREAAALDGAVPVARLAPPRLAPDLRDARLGAVRRALRH
eukprot:3101666-Pyramimonas_sp.AAC.1